MEINAYLPDGELSSIVVESDKIESISKLSEKDRGNLWIGPGLIDLQVNGFRGINFTSSDLKVKEVVEVTQKLWETGVTHYLPTITTSAFETVKKNVSIIKQAAESPETRGAILGIHIEGPFISAEDGPRGAHPEKYVRNPDWKEFISWQEAAGGMIKLLTLAPEKEGALEFIEKLKNEGIVVGIGHTNADRETILKAVEKGASFSTHLGNGSHSLIPRHDNYIWPQLACDELTAGIITDGHHLPPDVVKTFVRTKGIERLVITTDMSAIAGLPPGRYDLFERTVDVREDGKVCLAGTDYLAGSGARAYECLANAVKFTSITLADAFTMASYNPAKLMGIHKKTGDLKEGKEANYFVFNWDTGKKTIKPISTVIGGQVVWNK